MLKQDARTRTQHESDIARDAGKVGKQNHASHGTRTAAKRKGAEWHLLRFGDPAGWSATISATKPRRSTRGGARGVADRVLHRTAAGSSLSTFGQGAAQIEHGIVLASRLAPRTGVGTPPAGRRARAVRARPANLVAAASSPPWKGYYQDRPLRLRSECHLQGRPGPL